MNTVNYPEFLCTARPKLVVRLYAETYLHAAEKAAGFWFTSNRPPKIITVRVKRTGAKVFFDVKVKSKKNMSITWQAQ